MDVLNVKVISPQDTLFAGEALSVSSKNSSGNFDILAQHASFVTIIEKSPIVIRPVNQDKITFTFSVAVIYATRNLVTIYAQPESVKL